MNYSFAWLIKLCASAAAFNILTVNEMQINAAEMDDWKSRWSGIPVCQSVCECHASSGASHASSRQLFRLSCYVSVKIISVHFQRLTEDKGSCCHSAQRTRKSQKTNLQFLFYIISDLFAQDNPDSLPTSGFIFRELFFFFSKPAVPGRNKERNMHNKTYRLRAK